MKVFPECNSINVTKQTIKNISPLGFPWQTRDPFIFCVHHRDEFPEATADMAPKASLSGRNIGNDFTIKDGWRMYHGSKIPGFPYHPHRGFETVTVVKEGYVDHTDSLGASGRFGSGDVQWMTAGKGVQHSEMFPLLKEDEENPMELFQIWLNLPMASKLVQPHFRMIWRDTIPVVMEEKDGAKAYVDVIAGNFNDVSSPNSTPDSWAAIPENRVAIWTIRMEPNARVTVQSEDSSINRDVYFYGGEGLTINGKEIPSYHVAQVEADSDLELIAGDIECRVLILQGKPINEPVAQYGPFVMNTEAEIRQAFLEYQETEFGGWPWPEKEQVHSKDATRFAKHADGKEEFRPL